MAEKTAEKTPPGRPGLADAYRRLAGLCPPLDVTFADTDTPRTSDAAGAAPKRVAAASGGASVTGPDGRTAPRTASDAPGGPHGSAGPDAAGGPVALDLPGGPDALDALVDGASDRILAAHGRRPRRDAAASRLLHHYLWTACLLVTGPWYLAGRVPRLPPGALRIAPDTGRFTLDPSTPDAPPGGPAAVRDALAAHLGPVLEAFATPVRRGRRALWGMATDDLASGLWYLGRALGEERDGIRRAAAVLPGGTPPFPGAAAFRVLRGPSGRAHPTRTRLGCCLYYTLDAAEPCLTCPRLPDPERLRRLEGPGR